MDLIDYYRHEDIVEILDRSRSTLNKLSGKTVMVTGAGGFLGRYFIALFQTFNSIPDISPIYIIALDNYVTSSPPGKNDPRKIDENIEWIYGDAHLGSQLPNKVDFIFHLAGIASPEHYQANPLMTIDAAVNSTRALLEKARKDKARVLYFSSSEIYGDPHPDNVPTSEDYRGNVSCRGPRACYDESKRLGETLCWVYEKYFQVFVSVVRPFNIFGPGMMPKDYRVMPNFTSSLLNGKPIQVYGSGMQTRTFCYINDAIVAFLKILIEGAVPDVYNVGNPNPEISMRDLANLVAELSVVGVGVEVVDYPTKYPKDDPTRRCPDISKLERDFRFQPEVGLEEGIKRFLDWASEVYPQIK
jgi:UDP-glucuronate decarboxylase